MARILARAEKNHDAFFGTTILKRTLAAVILCRHFLFSATEMVRFHKYRSQEIIRHRKIQDDKKPVVAVSDNLQFSLIKMKPIKLQS